MHTQTNCHTQVSLVSKSSQIFVSCHKTFLPSGSAVDLITKGSGRISLPRGLQVEARQGSFLEMIYKEFCCFKNRCLSNSVMGLWPTRRLHCDFHIVNSYYLLWLGSWKGRWMQFWWQQCMLDTYGCHNSLPQKQDGTPCQICHYTNAIPKNWDRPSFSEHTIWWTAQLSISPFKLSGPFSPLDLCHWKSFL